MQTISACRLPLVALVAAGLAACGPVSTGASPTTTTASRGMTTSTTTGASTTTTTTEAPATTTTTRPAAPLAGKDLVTTVVLTRKDLASGLKLRPYEQGDQVRGQVSLDFCSYRFRTEKHRVARRQVAVTDSKGKLTGISNEVLAYDSAAQAAKALKEYRTSVRDCPKDRYLVSPVAGAPRLRFLQTSLGADAGLPVAENAVVQATVLPEGSERLYFRVVLQRRGRVLDLHYLVSDTPPAQSDLAGLLRMATATGTRLSGLPEGAVA